MSSSVDAPSSAGAAEEPLSLWAEQWAIQVAVKADTIEHRMRTATATRELDARQQAAISAVECLVRTAREAARRKRGSRGLRAWWRGTAIARAHQSLHAAETFLVEVLSEAEVTALIPRVVAAASLALPKDDPRRGQIKALSTMPPGSDRTAALQRVMDLAFSARDQLYVRVRDFRNVLLVAAGMIALLMGLLMPVVVNHPSAMPMCFQPSAVSGEDDPLIGGDTGTWQEVRACPSGDRRRPGGGDVPIVAGMGLLGGALAAAFAIRKVRGTSTPFEIPIALALLKVPSGSLTAVAGILLLSGGFVPGLSALDSQPQILAYALVFGYAQQLATRFIDDRAQTILNSLPSKDPEANPLEPQPSPRAPRGQGRAAPDP